MNGPRSNGGTTGDAFAPSHRLAWAAVVLAAVASAAGLLDGDLYRDDAALVALTRADDVFRLVVVVPVLSVGLRRWARGSVLGGLTALGALLALAYLYGFLAFGAALGPLTLAHISLFGLAFWALLLGFLGLDAARTSTAVDALIPRRATAAFLVAMAALSTVQWGATIAGAAVTGTLPADVASHGWATSPLYAIELAFAVPLLAIGGIGLWRHQPRGALLAVPLIVFLALLGLGLAWEPVFVALEGGSFDVATAMAGILFFALPGVLLAAILVRLHRAHAAS